MPNDNHGKSKRSDDSSAPVGLDSLAGMELNNMCVQPHGKNKANSHDNTAKKIDPPSLFDLHPIDEDSIRDMTFDSGIFFSPPGSQNVDAEPSSEDDVITPDFINLLHSSHADQVPKLPAITCKIADRIELIRLRENLFKELPPKKSHVVLLASLNEVSGQTMIIASLGLNIATVSDKSILLMDTNMYKSTLHTFLGYKPQKGLTDMIVNNLSWRKVVKETEHPNLYMLTSGLASMQSFTKVPRNYLRDLFTDLKKFFDIILVDSSSILRVNRGNIDTILLTTLADHSMLVINMNGGTKKQLMEIKEQLAVTKGSINSVICNNLPVEPVSSTMFNKLRKRWGRKNHGR